MSFLSAHRALPFSLSALAFLGMLNGCRDGADGPTANSTTSASETSATTSPLSVPSTGIPPTVGSAPSTDASTPETSPPATLPENESPYDFPVSISPSAGTVGTVITITATGCAGGEEVEFADRQVVDAGASTPGKSVPFQISGQTLTAKYTIAPDDSLGGAVVTVICGNGEGAASLEITST